MSEPWRLSVADLAREYSSGGLSPVDVVDACLRRIADVDGSVGAFTHVDAESARSAAREAQQDETSARSTLRGVPFGVKELCEVAGWPHTAGSLAWDGRVGARDSEAVRRLKAVGAIPIGLTRTHEFAMGVTTQHERRGSTRNPWSLDRVPGGSSGGSGAAVAAGMVPIALASDTSGSVRIPAVLCGAVGFRPTHGLIPLDGVVPLAPSYDTVGIIAREVADIVSAFAVLAPGREQVAPRRDLSGLRIGVPREFQPPVGEAQAQAVETAGAVCAELGAEIVRVTLPTAAQVDVAIDIQRAEMIDIHTRVLGTWPTHRDLLSDSLRSRLAALVERGADSQAGQEAITRIRSSVGTLGVDLVITPVAAQGPSYVEDPEGGDFRDSTLRCNHLQAVLGAPALAFPVGLDGDGLPVGVQLWGGPGSDSLVLSAGAPVRESLRHQLPPWPPLSPR